MTSKRVAIVTGASSGMGEALAEDLVGKGWQVAMADIQQNAELSAKLGDSASFHLCDVADYDSQAACFQQVWDKYGRIDLLCANAGIVDKRYYEIFNSYLENWRNADMCSSIYIFDQRGSDKVPPKPNLLCTDIVYKGVVYGTQLAIHFMRKNKVPGGAIISTCSVAGVEPHETYPEYDGAKAGVLNFVRATSRILKHKENIRINCILPGIVATKIIPPEMVAAVSAECLTPLSTITKAYNMLLDDESLNGVGLECSAEKVLQVPPAQLQNGAVSKRAVTVWEPLFKTYHGEISALPDAIA